MLKCGPLCQVDSILKFNPGLPPGQPNASGYIVTLIPSWISPPLVAPDLHRLDETGGIWQYVSLLTTNL